MSPDFSISPGGKIAQIQRNFPQTEHKIDWKEQEYKTLLFNLTDSMDRYQSASSILYNLSNHLARNFQINQTVKSDLAITPMDIEQTNFFYPTNIDESGWIFRQYIFEQRHRLELLARSIDQQSALGQNMPLLHQHFPLTFL